MNNSSLFFSDKAGHIAGKIVRFFYFTIGMIVLNVGHNDTMLSSASFDTNENKKIPACKIKYRGVWQ
jgi:hypothetical protein